MLPRSNGFHEAVDKYVQAEHKRPMPKLEKPAETASYHIVVYDIEVCHIVVYHIV